MAVVLAFWGFSCKAFGIYYTVKPGETLYSLSKRYGVPVEHIMFANNMSDPTKLEAGEEIFIPGANNSAEDEAEEDEGEDDDEAAAGASDKSKDTSQKKKQVAAKKTKSGKKNKNKLVAKKEVKPSGGGSKSDSGADKNADNPLVKLNKKDPNAAPMPGARDGLIWPTKGVVTSKFGGRWGHVHNGIDISTPKGQNIVAALSGKVLASKENFVGYGNIIILDHGELITIYAHCDKLLVSEGETVEKGAVIATVGDSGKAQGAHLHFEVRKGKIPVDPMDYLPKK